MPDVEKKYKVNTRGVGTPDYASPASISQVPVGSIHSSSDIAELASRIKPLNTLDRRGNIVFSDDFRDGIEKWVRADATWTAARSRSSGFSAYLNSSNPGVNTASITTFLPLMTAGVFGFSFTFNVPAVATREIDLVIVYHDGFNGYRYAPTFGWRGTGMGFGRGGALGFENYNARTFPFGSTAADFYNAKVVIDFATGKFIRFLVDGEDIDLSYIQLDRLASFGVTNYLQVRVQTQYSAYVDNVVVTQNEPV